MANRIKGITIELNANTVPLTEALQNTDSSLKKTQAELKDVNKLLKLDPTNVELLAQKQRLLGDAVKDTESKLKQEQEALKQLLAKNDGSDEAKEQINALKREIEDTTISLKNYQKQQESLQKTSKSLSQVTGELADKTRVLSVASASALTGLVGLAVTAGNTADELNTLSKQTGLSTEDLQVFRYGADRVDVSVEAITGSMSKLTKQIGSGNAYFEQLGVALTNIDGTTRSATDVFYDTVEALSKIENETDRDVIAMSLFGKGANELAGIIDDGGEAFRRFGQEAQDAGLILSQDMLDKANAFNDGIDELKAKLQATMLEVGAKMSENLLPAMEKLVDVGGKILEMIASVDSDTLVLITTILLAGSALSPVLKLVSTGLDLLDKGGILLKALGGSQIPSVVTSLTTGVATATASLSTIIPILSAIAVAGLAVVAIIEKIKQSKIDNKWNDYLSSTDGMTSISETQARNWVNSNEVQTMVRPDGSKSYWVNNSDYTYNKGLASQNGWDDEYYWGTNMTVNVDHINDLQDLLDIQKQAQLTTRMG